MAIPFALPADDDPEDQLIADLICMLQQLQHYRRLRRTSQILPRARATDQRSDSGQSSSSLQPPGLGASAGSTASNQRNLSASSHCRQRNNSESYCEEVKKTERTNPDWIQVGVTLRKIADDFCPSKDEPLPSQRSCSSSSESLFSKLVPAQLSGPIWTTAVICVVGWHLLRTR